MDYTNVVDIAKQHGAVLKRSRKHQIFELPTGANWVIPNTPSDVNGGANALGTLSKLLGIKRSDLKSTAPLRATRAHSKLEPYTFTLSALPTKEELKAAAKEARRLAKREAQERAEQKHKDLLRITFEPWLWQIHNMFWEDYEAHASLLGHFVPTMKAAVMDLYSTLKLTDFNPSVWIGDMLHKGKKIGEFLIVRQSGFYLDVLNNEIHDVSESEWYVDEGSMKGITFSVWGELYTRYSKRDLHWWLGEDAPPQGEKVTVEETGNGEAQSIDNSLCFQTKPIAKDWLAKGAHNG
jgi:hypothetical protein